MNAINMDTFLTSTTIWNTEPAFLACSSTALVPHSFHSLKMEAGYKLQLQYHYTTPFSVADVQSKFPTPYLPAKDKTI